MTGTFTLTGRILDKSKAPVARARLVLASHTAVLRDPVADEVYAPPPRVTTNADGYLCVADAANTPSDTPGVPLVVGVQYALRGVSERLLGRLVFTAPNAGTTLDLSDIVNEPVAIDPSWADALIVLAERLDALAAASEPTGTAAGLLADHLAAIDPHPQYLTLVEGTAAFDAVGAAATAQAAAATAATTKANAAQAAAIAAAATDATGKVATETARATAAEGANSTAATQAQAAARAAAGLAIVF